PRGDGRVCRAWRVAGVWLGYCISDHRVKCVFAAADGCRAGGVRRAGDGRCGCGAGAVPGICTYSNCVL
ncbi:hypothetical protein LPJ70_006287, partial [Coemansia sp. RSA 2708]